MCGSGQTTSYLLTRGAKVTGLDISNEVVDQFQSRWTRQDGEADRCSTPDCRTIQFDCVAVVGGLHHIHPEMKAAVREIHRVLKPGGYFVFMEPHTGSFPDVVGASGIASIVSSQITKRQSILVDYKKTLRTASR